jgi:pyrroloquinoline quinone (PQQ) biosynthesis protein C
MTTAAARDFLAELRGIVESHPGVNHPLLLRLEHVPFTRLDYRVMGLQHYALVGRFTSYMENLLVRAPDSEAKSWIAKVLVDEYGEGSEGKDHAELYREFLHATGVSPGRESVEPLHHDVVEFIAEHQRLTTKHPYLVGLGALGPGHEWAIPKMFPRIVAGLRRAGFAAHEIGYFTLHMEQDQDHGRWLEEALARFATTGENRAQIVLGTRRSLDARSRFWSAVQDKIVRWRQPKNLHFRTRRSWFGRTRREMTLAELRG